MPGVGRREAIPRRAWQHVGDVRRRSVADDDGSVDLDRLAAFLSLVHDPGGTTCAVEQDAANGAAQEELASGCFECFGKCIAQALRAALDIAATATQVAALRHGKQHPPQRVGVIVPVEHVGGERTFHRLVVAECTLQSLGER